MRRHTWQTVIRETCNTGNVDTRRAYHFTKNDARADLGSLADTYQRMGCDVHLAPDWMLAVAIDSTPAQNWFNLHGEVLGFSTYVITVEKLRQ